MAVPKQRRSSSRRDQRRMHIFLKVKSMTKCPKCGKPILPHTACPDCGNYRNREVINILAKIQKKEEKEKQKRNEANGITKK